MADNLIVADPDMLDGKASVRGTRPSVEFLLELAASGATPEQILAQYPQLTSENLSAAFRYAASCVATGNRTWRPPREVVGDLHTCARDAQYCPVTCDWR